MDLNDLENILINLGEDLHSARMKKNLTLKQLSDLSGHSVGTICDIENGRKQGSLKIIIHLANCLNKRMEIRFT